MNPDVLVLVVEDNIVNQRLIIRQLSKLGDPSETVADGQGALDALKGRPFTLILMDCEMPGMDGFQATREIRQRSGVASRIPIVAMTANALQGDRESCLAAGMDDYISKPVDMRVLAEVLEKWTRGRKPPATLSCASRD